MNIFVAMELFYSQVFLFKLIIPDPDGETPLQIWLNGNVIAERQILFYKCSGFPRYD